MFQASFQTNVRYCMHEEMCRHVDSDWLNSNSKNIPKILSNNKKKIQSSRENIVDVTSSVTHT